MPETTAVIPGQQKLNTKLPSTGAPVRITKSSVTKVGTDQDGNPCGESVDLKGETVRPVAGGGATDESGRYFSKEKGEQIQLCQFDNNALVGVPVSRLSRQGGTRVMGKVSRAFRQGWERVFGR